MPDSSATLPAVCPDPTTLHRYSRGELSATEAGTVEGHVGSCPACRQALDAPAGGGTSLGGLLVRDGSGSEVDLLPTRPDGEPAAAGGDPPDLPGYETVGRAGAGGMGEVWRVKDLQLDRVLAVKVLHGKKGDDPRWVRRFEEEARITARLTHPYVVPVHAMGRLADGRPYYTMKLVEGRTLASLAEGGPQAGPRRAGLVRVFGQVCQGVAFAHSVGVIHRDLKPANVMVGAHGEVQVMDWGLAKSLDGPQADPGAGPSGGGSGDAGPDDQTRPGSVLGTYAYMPPEQARGWVDRVDRRADVFGLGAILCQILTGQPPYSAPTGAGARLLAETARLGPARDRLRASGADPELVRLAEWCLAPEPAGRPADAGVVAEAVAAYLADLQQRAERERLEAEREKVWTAARRRRRLWIFSGLLLAVLAAVATWGVPAYLERAEQQRLEGWADWAGGYHPSYRVTATYRLPDRKCLLTVARPSPAPGDPDPGQVVTALFHRAEQDRLLDRVYGLDLSNLSLGRVPPEVFILPELAELRLGGNELKELPADVARLARLSKLVLAQNDLTDLPREVEGLAALTELDLADNGFKAVPPQVYRLTGLTSLVLKRNDMDDYDLPPEIGRLGKLSTLDLARTNLRRLPPEVGGLGHLTRLHVSRNKLTELPPEIGRLGNLASLHLSNNKLARLPPEVGQLAGLAELYAAECGLADLPPEVGRLRNLTTAHLSGNRLTAVPEWFVGLPKLRMLDLLNNPGLTEVPPALADAYRRQKTAVPVGTGPAPAGVHVHGSGKGGGK
ncbi:MAG: hypothetical protein C0501_14485 [Isosphaera sp.]|nr:hypothetical protein [Isosphaera sp.]